MNRLRTNVTVIFLVILLFRPASAQNFKQAKIYSSDRIFQHIKEIYLTSGELAPSGDFIITFQDAENAFRKWDEAHEVRSSRQIYLAGQIRKFFNQEQAGASVKITAGIDMMYHSVPDCTRKNLFYQNFRDKDFVTKYEERGRLMAGSVNLPLNKYLFLSSIVSFRNSWKYFNSRSFDFPKNLKELNVNVNEKATLLFNLTPITIIAGRDKIALGSGGTSKVLISENLPAVDHLHLNLKYKNIISLNHYVVSLKPNKMMDEYSKMLYAHRLTLHLFDRLDISLTEMVSSNEPFRFEYMNPFFIYHNFYDYPENRNVLTALELEFVPLPKLKSWFSFAVDEMDVEALEENGDMGREAFTLLAGLEYYNLFNITDSQFLIEWVRIKPWMYNHAYPWYDFYSLNFVYEENENRQNPQNFHRFIGHRLGSNAEALTAILSYQGISAYYEYAELGDIPLFSRAYSVPVNPQKEYRNILGLRYKNHFWNGQIDLALAGYFTDSKNFHQVSGLDKQYFEFWLSAEFKILEYLW